MEKPQSQILSKVNAFSAYIGFISITTFVVVILLSTKNFTHDPCYGEGCLENRYLLPMLGSLFIGAGAFGIMLLSGILRKITKSSLWRPPLKLGSLQIIIFSALAVIMFGAYFIGSLRNGVGIGATYSGEDLFNSVNQHRSKKGLNQVVKSAGLCDNLVSRWKAVKEDKQHEGFEEWVKQEGIETEYGYKQLVELYIKAPTPAAAIDFWTGSPGHELQLDNPIWTDGCAYASENIGVVVMGHK